MSTPPSPRDGARSDGDPDSWAAWMPLDADPNAVITRDELLTELAATGTPMSYRTLENWHLFGILPYPARRRHNGATRALYPAWALPLIKQIKAASATGPSLKRIAESLKVNPGRKAT